MRTRPISVTIVAVIYIVAGCVGLAYHAPEWRTPNAHHWEIVWISVLRALAIAAGTGMLYRHNWARWLAIGWMAFHVAISFFNGWEQVAFHGVFLLIVVWILLRRPAREYFSGATE